MFKDAVSKELNFTIGMVEMLELNAKVLHCSSCSMHRSYTQMFHRHLLQTIAAFGAVLPNDRRHVLPVFELNEEIRFVNRVDSRLRRRAPSP